jgi:hypothetical protein
MKSAKIGDATIWEILFEISTIMAIPLDILGFDGVQYGKHQNQPGNMDLK